MGVFFVTDPRPEISGGEVGSFVIYFLILLVRNGDESSVFWFEGVKIIFLLIAIVVFLGIMV